MSLAAGVISIGVLLSPPPPEAVRRAVDAVYADPSIQRVLPGAVPVEVDPDYDRSPRRARRGSGESVLGVDGGRFATVLLWGVGLVVAGVVVALIAQAVADRRRRAAGRGTSGAAGTPIAEGPVPPPIGDAERLAAEGRYAEAVHALLLRVVRDLTVDGSPVPPTFTSRETHARAAMSPPRRAAFGALVDAVERSLFGGRAVDAAAFEAARAAAARAAAPDAGPA